MIRRRRCRPRRSAVAELRAEADRAWMVGAGLLMAALLAYSRGRIEETQEALDRCHAAFMASRQRRLRALEEAG